MAKRVSAELKPGFSSGGGTFLDSAPLLFTVEEEVAVVVEEEAERLLKRVSSELGDAFSCVTGEVTLRGGVSGGVCGGGA